MKLMIFSILAVILLVALFDIVRLAFLRWRWNKRMRQLVKDVNWRHWISLVEAQLGRLVQSQSVRQVVSRDAQFFHDLWQRDFSSGAAVEKWFAEKNK